MTGPVEVPHESASPELAERVAAAVTATPGVAGLDGGIFGAIATYLPGRRLTGVRVGGAGEPVEVGVVVTFGRSIPDTVRAVRRAVAGVVAPGTDVDITVADISTDAIGGPAAAPGASVVVEGAATIPRRRVL